jgi:hypothetical protein
VVNPQGPQHAHPGPNGQEPRREASVLLTEQDGQAEPVMPAADTAVALLSRAVDFRSARAGLASAMHADCGNAAQFVQIVSSVKSRSASTGMTDDAAIVVPIELNVHGSFLTAR